jgi:hypothetical protein
MLAALLPRMSDSEADNPNSEQVHSVRAQGAKSIAWITIFQTYALKTQQRVQRIKHPQYHPR